jgi:hypothetical protein
MEPSTDPTETDQTEVMQTMERLYWPDPFVRMPEDPNVSHAAWTKFIEIHGKHPASQSPVLYALPNDLVDAINQEMPDFFSIDDAKFEQDLATLSGGGFFLHRPFTYIAIPGREVLREERKVVADLASRHEASARRIREMLVDEMRSVGYSNEQIAEWEQAKIAEKEKVAERQQGYAGWLITNPGFWEEREAFRASWLSTIEELGAFPPLPVSLMREHPEPPPEKYKLFYAEYCYFCRRWGLEGFVTWDLPVPMQPQLSGPCLYYLPAIQDAGVLAFIPWYLLRDREIELHTLAERVRMAMGPEHLRAWLDRADKDLGHARFGKMLLVYIYVELGLKSRYAGRLKGSVESLDRALAHYFTAEPKDPAAADREAETVRKIRQELSRRLKDCESQSKHQNASYHG